MVRRRLATVAALAALALCAPATAHADDCAGADVIPAADTVALVGQATLCLLNQQRAANGIGPLVENAALTTASAGYSQRMVAEGFFGHESPDGGTLVERLTDAGYLGDDDAWVVGENIGWGQASLATARSMVTAWMNSPGHRENLLSADYTQVGLGLALGTPTDQTWGATYTTDFRGGAAPAPPRAKAPPADPKRGPAGGGAAPAPPPPAAAPARRSRGGRRPARARCGRVGAERPRRATGCLSYPQPPCRADSASPPPWPSRRPLCRRAPRRARHRPTRRAQSGSPTSARPRDGRTPPTCSPCSAAPRTRRTASPACACSPRTSCPRSTSCSRAGRTTPATRG